MGDDIHPHPGICGGTVITPNQAVHVTAARLRFLLNVKGHGGAAAGERRR